MVQPVNTMTLEEYRNLIDPRDEAEFTRLLQKEGDTWGWRSYHIPDSRKASSAGFPDLVMVHPQFGTIFVELKMPGKYPRKDQREWLTALVHSGEKVFVWWPKDWADIKQVLQGAWRQGYETVVAEREEQIARKMEKLANE